MRVKIKDFFLKKYKLDKQDFNLSLLSSEERLFFVWVTSVPAMQVEDQARVMCLD